jgi:hypothetical protein
MNRITNKQQMYALLRSGFLGNTTPSYYNLEEWRPNRHQSQLWGLRSMIPNDPAGVLDLPTASVEAWVTANLKAGFSISPMVDQWLTFRGEVLDGPGGLTLCGLFGLRDIKWRTAFARHLMTWEGVLATSILQQVMNENSYSDLWDLIERYPNHVIEFTCLDRCYGTIPHRNAIVWEVRDY